MCSCSGISLLLRSGGVGLYLYFAFSYWSGESCIEMVWKGGKCLNFSVCVVIFF